jgi:transposase
MGSRQRTNTHAETSRTRRRNMSKQQQADAGTAMAKRYRDDDKPSIRQIAGEFGVSYGTAYRLMGAAGVEFRSHGGVRQRRPQTSGATAKASPHRGTSQAGSRA